MKSRKIRKKDWCKIYVFLAFFCLFWLIQIVVVNLIYKIKVGKEIIDLSKISKYKFRSTRNNTYISKHELREKLRRKYQSSSENENPSLEFNYPVYGNVIPKISPKSAKFKIKNQIHSPKILVILHIYELERFEGVYKGWLHKFEKYPNVQIFTFSGFVEQVNFFVTRRDRKEGGDIDSFLGLLSYLKQNLNNFDWYLKCDDDIYLYVDYLMEDIDVLTRKGKLDKPFLMGSYTKLSDDIPFCGGNNYIFNRKLLELTSECKYEEPPVDVFTTRIFTHDDLYFSWWMQLCKAEIFYHHGIYNIWMEMYLKLDEIQKWEEEDRVLMKPLSWHKIDPLEMTEFYLKVREIPIILYNFLGNEGDCVSFKKKNKNAKCVMINYVQQIRIILEERFEDTVSRDGLNWDVGEDFLLRYFILYSTGGFYIRDFLRLKPNKVNDLLKKVYELEKEIIIFSSNNVTGEINFFASVEKSDVLWLLIRDALWSSGTYAFDFNMEFVIQTHKKWSRFIRNKIYYLQDSEITEYFTFY